MAMRICMSLDGIWLRAAIFTNGLSAIAERPFESLRYQGLNTEVKDVHDSAKSALFLRDQKLEQVGLDMTHHQRTANEKKLGIYMVPI